MKLTKIGSAVSGLMALWLTSACAAHTSPKSTPPPIPPAPVVQAAPTPAPTPVAPVVVSRSYDGHVRHFSGWITPTDGSQSFTNTQMLAWDCDDPQGSDTKLRATVSIDGRAIILHVGLMGWGNEGYQAIDPGPCWSVEKKFIVDYRSRIVSAHVVDEPWDTAWSYWINGVYVPNRYNADVSRICSTVHGDFPDLPCVVNVGSVPDALVIPDGINEVWIEAYDADWLTKLDKIASRTSAVLGLIAPGFVAGDPVTLDGPKANIVRAEWTEAQANPRIQTMVFFLWCCTDTTTGDKNFYAVGDVGRLPQLTQALADLGHAIFAAVR